MILEEELRHVWARHEAIARAVWAACDAWGKGGPLAMNIADPALRSHAVTALSIGAPNGLRGFFIPQPFGHQRFRIVSDELLVITLLLFAWTPSITWPKP